MDQWFNPNPMQKTMNHDCQIWQNSCEDLAAPTTTGTGKTTTSQQCETALRDDAAAMLRAKEVTPAVHRQRQTTKKGR